ncbi:retrovirus-related pol polyprotein from transposon TNT 1-94, partial [Tanacetum coccineum]
MSTANQKTLAESGALDRPSILEKGSFVPWASRFLRFLENKQEEGELMQNSIDNGIKVINYILQGIPNNIYNSIDACPDAQQLWKRIKRLMQEYDELYDPLDLVANSYAQSLHSHASPSYSYSPQPYYVTHPSSMIDNDDDYQGVIQKDAQEDKLTTIMLLLARAITQHYSTPTNNFLRSSSNIRNQTVIQDGRLDIQRRNVGYAVNGNRNTGRQNRNQATNAKNGLVQSIKEYDQNVNRIPRTKSTSGKTNVQCYNCNRKGHYARECPKLIVCDAKYFKERMLVATKDDAGVHLDEKRMILCSIMLME